MPRQRNSPTRDADSLTTQIVSEEHDRFSGRLIRRTIDYYRWDESERAIEDGTAPLLRRAVETFHYRVAGLDDGDGAPPRYVIDKTTERFERSARVAGMLELRAQHVETLYLDQAQRAEQARRRAFPPPMSWPPPPLPPPTPPPSPPSRRPTGLTPERVDHLRLLREMGAINPTIERDHDWEREDLLPLRSEMHPPSFPPPATEVVSTNSNGVIFGVLPPFNSFLSRESSPLPTPRDPECSLARGCQGFCTTCSRCQLHCTCEKVETLTPPRRIKL